MSKGASHKISNPKTYVNYISAIISLTIMLYLLGISGLGAIYTNQLVNWSKENIPFYVELKDDANKALVFSFQKKLEVSTYAKPQTVEYLSKEQALELLGEDDEFLAKEDVMLFGENLLPNMIRFCIKNEKFGGYEEIVKEIEANEFVEHVFYTEDPAQNLARRVYRLEIILLVLMLFFIFVAITLIKNTLKLLLVANKDLLKTMQLVGSTREYMVKPYINQSLKNGLLSGIIAIGCIWVTRYLLQSELGALFKYNIDMWTIILSSIVLFTGVFLSWICTRHSINKYFKKPVEEWEL